MCEACEHRDEANQLLDEADILLHNHLDLPHLVKQTKVGGGYSTTKVKASELLGRFDAAFHDKQATEATHRLSRIACEITSLADCRVSKEIRAVTKFRKRVYVPNGGMPLLNSKQLFQIAPIGLKGIAKGAHLKDIPEIGLKTNMIAITCSGTIGKVQIIPEYMSKWSASQDALRLIAQEEINAGYLYAWLASDYGKLFLTRHSYGSVIVHIDKDMLSSIPVPVPSKEVREEIGNLVLKANELRDLAWRKEQDAIGQIENLVQGRVD